MSETVKGFHRLKAAAVLTLLLLAYQQIARSNQERSQVVIFYPTKSLTESRYCLATSSNVLSVLENKATVSCLLPADVP